MMCYARTRPLPGQPRPAQMGHHCFGMAVDLRGASTMAHTALRGGGSSHGSAARAGADAAGVGAGGPGAAGTPEVAADYFGNASFSIHIPGNPHLTPAEGGAPAAAAAALAAAAQVAPEAAALPAWSAEVTGAEWEAMWSDEKRAWSALACGAVRLRQSVEALRARPAAASDLLRQLNATNKSPLSAQVSPREF